MTEKIYNPVIAQAYASRPDVTGQPLIDPENEWFMDGSSFVLNAKCKTGYAVVSQENVSGSHPLPSGTSAQKDEQIALTRAFI
jgi:hypothetical protein